jgi:transposase
MLQSDPASAIEARPMTTASATNASTAIIDGEAEFLKNFARFKDYPDNIIHNNERIKLIEAYLEHHKQTKDKILLNAENAGKALVPFKDYGSEAGPNPNPINYIKNPEMLRTRLG